MTRIYSCPTVDQQWGNARETSQAVAVAIHAIADSRRSPQEIWEMPTADEERRVIEAVSEYVRHGDFSADDAGFWGQSRIFLANERKAP